ncbi:hypothetical protein ASPACDRAFT_115124 [Aspergillus aculeatus ATCC 16872]|uniref:Dimethylallyltranstransferase n=1 Tax=Aspergillus aculeatus (strain ATCC 16872 / CBS 172.66 / WB 5094) TaxID=690307 RepID=A0A1L9X1L5_ASPA1|nr:uncharacterized protein ASPACDRAFT_115124 [Aspergillus aculeatus ATCC 16872]OJK02333.1 hypothetical protein ASPACDRAFT_115124 [Aspergillus aculeatus ATCC 16872]
MIRAGNPMLGRLLFAPTWLHISRSTHGELSETEEKTRRPFMDILSVAGANDPGSSNTGSPSSPSILPPSPKLINYQRLPASNGSYGGGISLPPAMKQLVEESPEQQLLEVDPLASTTQTEPIMAPFRYMSSLPSKGVRDQLLEALNVWVGTPRDLLPQVGAIVADIHNISLMLDDVEDGSPLRRSRPAAHTVFGIAQTINAASYQLVDVISRASEMGTECQSIIIDAMKKMLIGQSLDLHWVQHVSPPTLQEYLQMIDGKTGALFCMIERLMTSLSHSTTTQPPTPSPISSSPVSSLSNLLILFGRFFQVRDDYANLVDDQYQAAKGHCEDLDEGKWSFILLHALEYATPTTRSLLMNLLMQRHALGCAGRGHKQLILQILREETKSLAYTASALETLRQAIEGEIRRVEVFTGVANPLLRGMVERLRVRM